MHPIKIALYVGVAFGPDELERISAADGLRVLERAAETAAMAGLSRDDLQAAADAFAKRQSPLAAC